jgi:parvulin-like peptidyl-prolyl isomerase
MPRVRERHPTRSRSAAVRLAALYPSRRQIRRWKRERRAHQTIVGVAIGVVVLVLAILGFGYLRENVLRASDTAASVNGQTITLAQLVDRVKPRAAALDAQAAFYQTQGLAQAATQINLQRSGLPDSVLDSMVEEKLVAAELSRRGIDVSDADVDDRIHKEISEQDALSQPSPTPTVAPEVAAGASPAPTATSTPGPAPTPTAVPTLAGDAFQTAYQTFLTRAGLTDAAYRELVRADVARDKLRESLASDLPTTAEMVHARHILVDNQDSLQQAQQQLASGVPFDEVAKALSTDTGTRDKGGDLGWFPRGQMNAPFEEAAFSQPISEIGQPVTSPNGMHIIQVLERDAAHPLTKEQIDQKAAKAYQDWYTAARGGEAVSKQLTPEGRAWVLRQIAARRTA